MDRKLLGRRLAEYRRARGWSQERLGEVIGKNQRMIAKLEAGTTRGLTIEEADLIAESLDLPADWYRRDLLPTAGLFEVPAQWPDSVSAPASQAPLLPQAA